MLSLRQVRSNCITNESDGMNDRSVNGTTTNYDLLGIGGGAVHNSSVDERSSNYHQRIGRDEGSSLPAIPLVVGLRRTQSNDGILDFDSSCKFLGPVSGDSGIEFRSRLGVGIYLRPETGEPKEPMRASWAELDSLSSWLAALSFEEH